MKLNMCESGVKYANILFTKGDIEILQGCIERCVFDDTRTGINFGKMLETGLDNIESNHIKEVGDEEEIEEGFNMDIYENEPFDPERVPDF